MKSLVAFSVIVQEASSPSESVELRLCIAQVLGQVSVTNVIIDDQGNLGELKNLKECSLFQWGEVRIFISASLLMKAEMKCLNLIHSPNSNSFDNIEKEIILIHTNKSAMSEHLSCSCPIDTFRVVMWRYLGGFTFRVLFKKTASEYENAQLWNKILGERKRSVLKKSATSTTGFGEAVVVSQLKTLSAPFVVQRCNHCL